jgi:hypothetical protein
MAIFQMGCLFRHRMGDMFNATAFNGDTEWDVSSVTDMVCFAERQRSMAISEWDVSPSPT